MFKAWTGQFAVSAVLFLASAYFLWAFLTELLAMVASIIVAGLWYAARWAGTNLRVLLITYGALLAWKDQATHSCGNWAGHCVFLKESQANDLPHANHHPCDPRRLNSGPRRFASAHSHRRATKRSPWSPASNAEPKSLTSPTESSKSQ